jgi:hypothetical protein
VVSSVLSGQKDINAVFFKHFSLSGKQLATLLRQMVPLAVADKLLDFNFKNVDTNSK